jgi:hypothetical protein
MLGTYKTVCILRSERKTNSERTPKTTKKERENEREKDSSHSDTCGLIVLWSSDGSELNTT